MKIIISAQALVPWSGGSAFSEASLCAEMSKLCEVTIVCRKGSLDYSFAASFGIKQVHEYEPKDVFEAWRDRDHWISRLFEGVDLMHLNGHWRWEDYFFARMCVRRDIPYVLQPRGMLLLGHRNVIPKRIYNQVIGNWVVNHSSKVIALSRYETSQYTPYHIPSEKLMVLPNGISQTVMEDRIEKLPSFISDVAGSPYFLYLGRLEGRKNLLFLVDVFGKYISGGGAARLFLVGPSERNYDKKLEQRIREMGVEGKVKILSPVYGKEKWELIQSSTAVLYPTLLEPFGRVPFEAILGGALPIVPDASGSAEYLSPFIPDCIYKDQDANSLLEAIVHMETLEPEEKKKKLEFAQRWVRTELSWQKIAQKVLMLYQSSIGTEEKREAV